MDPIKTKHVTTVTVTDPDSNLPVDVEIRKLETGGMVGIDASFLEQEVGIVYSPYDSGVELDIPEDEAANECSEARIATILQLDGQQAVCPTCSTNNNNCREDGRDPTGNPLYVCLQCGQRWSEKSCETYDEFLLSEGHGPHVQIVENYVKRLVAVILQDAKDSTSIEEEVEQLVRSAYVQHRSVSEMQAELEDLDDAASG